MIVAAVETGVAVETVADVIADPVADEGVTVSTLSSGLRVVCEHVPGALSVSAGIWVGVGARDEPAPLCGVSHFLEHLLFKGTQRRSAREIATAVDRVGGDMNAYTSKESTAYLCRVPARHLGLALDILGDVITSPSLRDDDVESERHVILEELAMDDDAPDDTAYRLFADAVFPEHPLGRETAGDPTTVRSITADDVREYFAATYGVDRMVVAVAGPIVHDEVVAWAESTLGQHRRSTIGVDRSLPTVGPRAVVGEERDCEQVHIVVGGRALDRHDPDREALDMVMHALGGGPSSRLFQTIREERGLTYSTYSSSSSFSDAGLFAAYAATNPEHAAEVRTLLDAEIDAISKHGITAEELEVAKGYLTGAFSMGFEGTGSRLERIGSSLTNYGRIRPLAEQVRRWESVTLDDTRRVVERVLSGTRVRCAVGPVVPAALLG